MARSLLARAAGAAALVVPVAAHAALLEAEPFNYPTNLGTSVNALNGGTGWGGAWSNAAGDVTVASTNASLGYPATAALTPSGSRVEVTGAVTAAQATRTLGTTMNLATGGQSFYSSALFRRSAVTGELATASFFSGSNLRWFYGIDNNGNFTVAVDPAASPSQRATTAFSAAADTTYLVVARIRTNTGPGGNDEVFLKVFAPGSTVAEPLTDAGWDVTANGNSGVTLSTVRLDFNNAAGQTNQFDEFRIGTAFTDVTGVPEPGSAVAAGLAGAGLLAGRRRRRAC